MKKRIVILLVSLLFVVFLTTLFTGCYGLYDSNGNPLTQSVTVPFAWQGGTTGLPAAPANPQTGWAYYNNVTNASYWYDGANWNILSAGVSSLALTSAHILVGDAGNVAADVAASGDLTLDNTGKFTVKGLQGVSLPALATGYLNYDSGTGLWAFGAGGSGITSIGVTTPTSLTGILTGNGATIGSITDNSATWNTALQSAGTAPGTYNNVTVAASGLVTSGSNVSYLSPTLASGDIFVGNVSNMATAVALSGDATLSNTGAIALTGIAAGCIVYVPLSGDIQTYVNNATAGDTLILGSGTYTIASTININKQLNIVGQGNAGFYTIPSAAGHGTLIQSSDDSVTAFNITSSNVRIANLSLELTGDTCNGIYVSKNLVGLNFTNVAVIINGTGTEVGFNINNSDAVMRDLTFYITSADGIADGVYFFNDNTAMINSVIDCFNVTGAVHGAATFAYAFGVDNNNTAHTITLNLSNSVCRSLSGTPKDWAVATSSTTTSNAAINAYLCTFDGADYDCYQTGTNQINLGGSVLVNNKVFGTVTYRATVAAGTFNGLTLTSQATGFTIAGGTTPYTLTVSGNATLTGNNTVPTGGTANQVLSKIDGTDYNTHWIAAPAPSSTVLHALVDPQFNNSMVGTTTTCTVAGTYYEPTGATTLTCANYKRIVNFNGSGHVSAGTGTIQLYDVTSATSLGTRTFTSVTEINISILSFGTPTNASDVVEIRVANNTNGATVTIDSGAIIEGDAFYPLNSNTNTALFAPFPGWFNSLKYIIIKTLSTGAVTVQPEYTTVNMNYILFDSAFNTLNTIHNITLTTKLYLAPYLNSSSITGTVVIILTAGISIDNQ